MDPAFTPNHIHRKSILIPMKLTITFAFISFVLRKVAVQSPTGGANRSCRCLFGDRCWPDASAFSQLASQVSQPLIQPIPPASACYPTSNPSGNCTKVQTEWEDGNWRSDQPGSMQATNFETFIFPNKSISACYLNTTLGAPCEQGSVPVMGVDARSVADVQAGVKFAANHNLRLAIKNTGHDYLGRSTARGSFLIWTHNFKNITFHDTFTPVGGPKAEVYEKAVTLGAGVQWHEAYAAAHDQSRDMVGGVSTGGSVGAAGGWVLGGGHSALARKYGLGVDNVLEFTIVSSKGENLTVNAHQNSDLFWALRGGGGGTYGVVTSVTYLTHPSTPLIAAFFASTINNTGPEPSLTLNKLFTEFVRISPNLSDGGWGGYSFVAPGPGTTSPAFQFFMVAPNISWGQANESIHPFFNYASTLASNSSVVNGGTLNITALTLPVESFFSCMDQFIPKTGQVGSNAELGSRLLPRVLIEQDYQKVADTLLALPGVSYYLVAGGAVSAVNPASTGLNPAWRKALVHTVFGTGWPEGESADGIQQRRDTLRSQVATLHALAPDSGAYFNEASLYDADPKVTFFGSHYNKLKAIKDKYDPIDLFVVAKGVGFDDWDESLNCRK